MIRLSTKKDIEGIISLWNEAFGDSEKEILFFLNAHYKPENTVVCECDGEIASVLFLLEGNMHIRHNDYPSYYLYAACTFKKYRGRGFMAELLDFAKINAAERNFFFIALKPAEKSLFDYYSKFGYKTVFKKKNVCIDILSDNNIIDNSVQNINADLVDIRDRFFENIDYFKWDSYSVSFAADHHKYYGGKVFINCNGYLLYSINDGVLTVKENTFSMLEFKNIVKNIAVENSASSVRAELSFYSASNDLNAETFDSGMLLPLSEKAESIMETIDNAYLSLTLD